MLDDFAAAAERATSALQPELPPSRSSAVAHRGAAVPAIGLSTLLEGERWALFLGRRPDLVAGVALVAMLAIGFLVSGFIAMEQGEVEWEPSDKGQFLGGVAHLVVIGGLVIALWWQRAVTVVIVATPIVTGVVAFRVSPLSTAGMGDTDFRDDATLADGFPDVFPYTLASALLIAAVLAFVVLRRRAVRAA